MKCDELNRWLDLGSPESEAPAALAHAGHCRRCAAALEAARQVESLLATSPAPAPAGFTDRVMARVANAHAARARAHEMQGSPIAWWARAAAEPATALAVGVAGLMLWQGGALWAGAASLALQLGQAVAGVHLAPRLGPSFGRPEIMLAFALALAPAAAWASWGLYRWSERLARPSLGSQRPITLH